VSNQDDKVFIKQFSGILIALVVFTVAMALIGWFVQGKLTPSDNPSRTTMKEERIAPVGGVFTGAAGEQAVVEAVPAAAVVSAGAFDGSLDGAMLYNSVCMACHTTGAAGAPIPGTDVWAERAAKGLDALVAAATNGINAMPPKGGRTDLSDDQVKAAVEFMLAQ
jgi:cytochrome c5